MSTIAKVLPTPPDNFSTQIASSTVSSTALTVQLDSVAGLPTEGVGQFFKKDANGDIIAGSIEFVHWTNIAGSSITFTDTGDRGITGSDSGAQSYVADDYFEVWVSSYYSSNYSMDVEHNSDGTHDSTKVAMLAGAQTFTGTKTFDKELVAKQLDTPSSPSSGYNKLYFKNDDKLYKLTSGGTETEVGATSGGDWTNYTAVTPTSGTLDDPSFEFTFAGVDLSTTIYPGMRLKVTQGTVKYFIVTKVAFSTNTTITAYGGTDYDLVSTGTTAISAFAYSSVKAPAGFPLDPTKWTVEATDTSSRTQASPGAGTWYNLGSVSISIPIGIWDTQFKVNAGVLKNSSTVWNRVYTTLSTANNSATDADLTAGGGSYSSTSMDRGIAHTLSARKNIVLTTKTTHYLNTSCESASTTLYNNNDLQKLIIRAVCAYL